MPRVLVFNPGSASVKFEIVVTVDGQQVASDARKLFSGAVEGIGKTPEILVFKGREIASREPSDAADFAAAAQRALAWLREHEHASEDELDLIAIRVVHGGDRYDRAQILDASVRRSIEELEELAPLHNKNSLLIADAVGKEFGDKVPVAVTFDTAFHRTIPEQAALYPIPIEISERHKIRRYGFHGPSHRYQMERYAQIQGKRVEELDLVTLHLESGCSATAIRKGKSVDNTMGFTPLEGLMMGTRSGDVDPALVPYLAEKENIGIDEVMTLLNKKSGMLGVSGDSLDTRVLMKKIDSDRRARLALEMFAYRVRKAIGAYLAALGGADAVLFGGGISEDSPWIRERICEGFDWCGLHLDEERNQEIVYKEGRISTDESTLEAFVISVEEGLQIAHECARALAA